MIPGAFDKKWSAGERIKWPIKRYKSPIFDVRVPKKNVIPIMSSGRVKKASPTELLISSICSIYRIGGF
jgi:hypothetical protein